MLNIDGMPIKGNGDSGDSMLWSGLMVAAGDRRPIAGIRQCQTLDGRIWRCVDRVNNQPQNSFSRDMALGFLLYVSTVKDYGMANRWVSYIKRNKSLFPSDQSTDTRHIVTPTLWWLMSYSGIKVPLQYRLSRFLYKPYQKIEIKFGQRGFQTHLQGVACLIMAINSGKRDIKIGEMLYKKEPNNAFFAWLAGKNEEARSINNRLRKSSSGGNQNQWCWERTDSEEAWKDSMGWDFLFIDMLLKTNIK